MNLPIALNWTDSRLSTLAGRYGTQPDRILMVDDDVNLCHLMKVIREREGFALASEHTLASGLRRVVEDRFAIVLLDVVLPDGDGSVAMSDFHVRSGLPVIMMTGTGDAATREACLVGGAVGYLTKPFPIPKLLTLIRLFA